MRPIWKSTKSSTKENNWNERKLNHRTKRSHLKNTGNILVPYPGIYPHFHSKMLEWMSYFKLRAIYESLYGALKRKAKRARKTSTTSWKPKLENLHVKLEQFHVNVKDFSTFLWDGTDHLWQGYE